VTGGNGFIGSHLVEMLVAAGAVVTSTAPSETTRFRYLDLVRDRIRTVVGDLANPDVAWAAVTSQQVVMHLAAKVGGIEYNVKHPGSIFAANMCVFMSVLETARQAGVERFLVTSSACVYPRQNTSPTPEDAGFLDRPELSGQQGSAQRAAPGKEGREARLRGSRAAVHRSVRAFIAEARQPPDRPQLELTSASYDADELLAAIDVLLDDRLTMGPRVAALEEEWCRDRPAHFAVMVNSGSSANLLAFSALSFPEIPGHLPPGDEVIIPAVAWSTSLFPIMQMGCIPVLVDIDLDTVNIDVDAVWQAITPRTRALMLVHLLGNPCDMGRLMDIAQEHRLRVIEDCCEAHGASIRGQRVGTFGDLAAFSFYFAHHMTSIEGGVICGHNRQTW